MAYREDPDLEFLANCNDKELATLVFVLTHDPNDGEKRLTEELSHELNPSKSLQSQWKKIAAELQCFGADTWATLFRWGKGVTYRELLCDACEKLDIDISKLKNEKIAIIERMYLKTFLKKAIKNMDTEKKLQFSKIINEHIEKGVAPSEDDLNQLLQNETTFTEVVKLGAQALSARGTAYLAAFGLEAIGLEFLGGLLGGPIGLILAGSVAVSGPAYRVTIPACYMVAALRLFQLSKARQSFM